MPRPPGREMVSVGPGPGAGDCPAGSALAAESALCPYGRRVGRGVQRRPCVPPAPPLRAPPWAAPRLCGARQDRGDPDSRVRRAREEQGRGPSLLSPPSVSFPKSVPKMWAALARI